MKWTYNPSFLKTKKKRKTTNKSKQTTAKSKHIKTEQKTETKNLIIFYAVFKLCRLIKNGAFNKVDVFQGLFFISLRFYLYLPLQNKSTNFDTRS